MKVADAVSPELSVAVNIMLYVPISLGFCVNIENLLLDLFKLKKCGKVLYVTVKFMSSHVTD